MVTMLAVQVVICVLFHGLEISAEVFEGKEREKIVITCSHKWAESNEKSFCKDPCKSDEDILIDSNKKTSGRYQLQDEGTGIFRVTITDLKKTDSGKYWCAVKRVFRKTYNEVDLRVLDASPTSPPPRSSTQTDFPSTVSFWENISTISDVTSSTEWTTLYQTSEDNKTDWQFYIIVSASVILLTFLVWILVFLVLYCKACAHPALEYFTKLWCCREKRELKVSYYGEGSSESNNFPNSPPGSTDTEPEYENISTSLRQNMYRQQR